MFDKWKFTVSLGNRCTEYLGRSEKLSTFSHSHIPICHNRKISSTGDWLKCVCLLLWHKKTGWADSHPPSLQAVTLWKEKSRQKNSNTERPPFYMKQRWFQSDFDLEGLLVLGFFPGKNVSMHCIAPKNQTVAVLVPFSTEKLPYRVARL